MKQVSLALVVTVFIGACVTRDHPSIDNFREAINQEDYQRADQLWDKGVNFPENDPFVQFMLIKDRLETVQGVKVTEWKLGRLQSVNGYFGLIDIHDSQRNVVMGIGLAWENRKWTLKTDMPQLPSYVRNSIDLVQSHR